MFNLDRPWRSSLVHATPHRVPLLKLFTLQSHAFVNGTMSWNFMQLGRFIWSLNLGEQMELVTRIMYFRWIGIYYSIHQGKFCDFRHLLFIAAGRKFIFFCNQKMTEHGKIQIKNVQSNWATDGKVNVTGKTHSCLSQKIHKAILVFEN